MVTQGQGKFESKETGKISVAARQAMLLFPNIWHRDRPDHDAGWTEKWMQFDGMIVTQLVKQKIFFPSHPIVNPPDFRAAEDLLNRLLDMIHHAPTANTMTTDAIVVAALDYIWIQGRNVLGVPEVAGAIGVARRTLERHLLTTLGHGVLKEIINCRFSRAGQLLRSTRLPLKIIVHVSDFGSLENMRQVFIARTAMFPQTYRRFHASGAR